MHMTQLSHLVIRILLLCFVVNGSATIAGASTNTRHGLVTWVYDGDTIKVQGVGTVRLIGIDCPEKSASDRDWKYLKMGCKDSHSLRDSYSSTLKTVIELCKGKMVQIRRGSDHTDRYGRILAYVWLPDGRMLNRVMLQEGRAMVYRRFDFVHKENFIALESEARQKQRGIWQGLTKETLEKRVDYSRDPAQETPQ